VWLETQRQGEALRAGHGAGCDVGGLEGGRGGYSKRGVGPPDLPAPGRKPVWSWPVGCRFEGSKKLKDQVFAIRSEFYEREKAAALATAMANGTAGPSKKRRSWAQPQHCNNNPQAPPPSAPFTHTSPSTRTTPKPHARHSRRD
jgi:hypothetical protein